MAKTIIATTASTPEKRALRSRIQAWWRVLFAIVGLLDCSCFCYCYIYQHDSFGGSNGRGTIAASKMTKQPRPRSSRKEPKQLNRQRHPKKKKNGKKNRDNSNTDANIDVYTANSITVESDKLPRSTFFKKQHGLSSVVWRSMAFHHHPTSAGTPSAVSSSNKHSCKNETPPFENKSYRNYLLLHLGFGILCLIEMIIRAKEARRVLLRNKAIAAFEDHIASTVAKVYQQRPTLAVNETFSYKNLKSIATGHLKSNLYVPSLTALYADSTDKIVNFNNSSGNKNIIGDDGIKNTHDQNEDKEGHDQDGDNNDMDVDINNEATNNRSVILILRSTFGSWLSIVLTYLFSKNVNNIVEDGEITNLSDRNKGKKSHDHDSDDSDTNANINDEATNKRSIILFLRSTFGLWLPIGVTCLFWLSLLPFKAYYRIIQIFLKKYFDSFTGNMRTEEICGLREDNLMEFEEFCDIDCSHSDDDCITSAWYLKTLGDDTAWATLWLTNFVAQGTKLCEDIQEYFMSTVWKRYLLGDKKRNLFGDFFQNDAQKKLHKILFDHKRLHAILFNRPKLIWFRLGRILNIVKLVRFAGPLTRMFLKLQDQLFAGYGTFWKHRSSNNNREQRLQRPSLLLQDLRRLQSFHKVETSIAALPSRCNVLLDSLAKKTSQHSAYTATLSPRMATAYAEEFLSKSRERGKQITMQIEWLQKQFKKGVSEFSPMATEIHDRILQMSKDLSKRNLFSVYSKKDTESPAENEPVISPRSRRTVKKRWFDFLHLGSLLSSRDYLISPRSRFSVVWRITVTNCLLFELTRLSLSWHLTQTFHLSISQVIGRLFVDCGTIEEDTKRKFRFFTNLIEEWHVGLSRAIPFVPFPKESLWVLCVPTSWFSKLLLLLGTALETFIDIVSFLDIFIWFFTGDLDPSTGIVVPKAFFSRCILPGTLVQVIDHPTLPNVLPSLLARLAAISSKLGWSRLVLWSCALVPALIHEFFIPALSYFFRHLDETENWNDSSGIENKDILMTCAESFGYLPTRKSQMMERRMTSLWLGDVPDVERSSTSSTAYNEDDDDYAGDTYHSHHLNNNEGILRPPSRGSHLKLEISGILTPPGSPRRNVLRETSVRFAEEALKTSKEEEEESSSPYDSWGHFDIGLSLSSHNLDGLNETE